MAYQRSGPLSAYARTQYRGRDFFVPQHATDVMSLVSASYLPPIQALMRDILKYLSRVGDIGINRMSRIN